MVMSGILQLFETKCRLQKIGLNSALMFQHSTPPVHKSKDINPRFAQYQK